MSLPDAVIDAMVQAGCTAEQLAAAMKAANAQDDIRREKKRANNAERQRRYRERHAESNDSNALQDVTERDSVTPPLSRPLSPQTPLTPTHTPGIQTRARKGGDFPCPVWAEPAVWDDLKRNRRQKRLANTATAHRQFVSQVEAMADDHWPPGRLLEAIVAKGWGGAHDPRDDRKPGNDNRRQANSNRNAVELAREKLGQVR